VSGTVHIHRRINKPESGFTNKNTNAENDTSPT
jgi:hypothetical protein